MALREQGPQSRAFERDAGSVAHPWRERLLFAVVAIAAATCVFFSGVYLQRRNVSDRPLDMSKASDNEGLPDVMKGRCLGQASKSL
jgi:hypothetical protein